MSDWTALRRLRIGCVKYLNSRPLIDPYNGPVHFAHPAELSDLLAKGELDAALIPAFEFLRHPEYQGIDGVSISARGPVYSVVLAWKGPLARVRSIFFDPASRSSANLVRVLLAEYYGLAPVSAGRETADALLLIGSQAIEFRRAEGSAYHYMDLGEEWFLRTGLPMVFAVWAVREKAASTEVANALRDVAASGQAEIPNIAKSEPDPVFALRYLTENIRYSLGDEEKRGMAKFLDLLVLHAGLAQHPLRWI